MINIRNLSAYFFVDSIISQILLEITLAISTCFPLTIYHISYVIFKIVEKAWLTCVTLCRRNVIQIWAWMVKSDLLKRIWSMSCLNSQVFPASHMSVIIASQSQFSFANCTPNGFNLLECATYLSSMYACMVSLSNGTCWPRTHVTFSNDASSVGLEFA